VYKQGKLNKGADALSRVMRQGSLMTCILRQNGFNGSRLKQKFKEMISCRRSYLKYNRILKNGLGVSTGMVYYYRRQVSSILPVLVDSNTTRRISFHPSRRTFWIL
jgi:hypothetical protein